MTTTALTLDDGSTFENPTVAQQAQFSKLNAIKIAVLSDPSVAEAIAGFEQVIPEQKKFKAEHLDSSSEPESPAYLQAGEKLIKAIADSLKQHGIEGAPSTLGEFSNTTDTSEIPRAFEASVMSKALGSEDVAAPGSAPERPRASVRTIRSGRGYL